jgi:hypothetical protein
MPLKTTTITLNVNGGEEKYLGTDNTTASFPGVNPLFTDQVVLSNGTGSASAQKVGLASFSLTGGASVTFDLTAFAGPYGNVNFSSIKECIVDNGSTTAADVLEAGDDGTVTNPWTSPFAGSSVRMKVHPGAPWRIASPIAGYVVDATHKSLMVKNTNSGTNVLSGNVLLIGEGT